MSQVPKGIVGIKAEKCGLELLGRISESFMELGLKR